MGWRSSTSWAGKPRLRRRRALCSRGRRSGAGRLDTLQYLHGPLEVAEPGRGCVVFGSDEVQLAAWTSSHGASVLLVTEAPVDSTENLRVVRIPEVPDVFKPILEILLRTAPDHHMSKARDPAADGFRHEQEDTKLEVG